MRNINAWLCIREAIKFYKENNPEGMRKYGHDLVVAGSKKMAEIWGTEVLIENEE